MIDAKQVSLEQQLLILGWGKRFSQSLLELLLPFALCAAVVGGVWYLLQA
jgi:hypothetical protein